jgi:CAAX prenyl protease-like protein
MISIYFPSKSLLMAYSASQKLSGIIAKFTRLPVIAILASGFAIQVLLMLLFATFWWQDVSGQVQFRSSKEQFILVVILAPVFETLIFQYSIIDMVLIKFKSEGLAILLSALGFSLIHVYSVQYWVATFLSGLLFAFLFLVLSRKNSKPILYITILHAVYNLFVLWMRP